MSHTPGPWVAKDVPSAGWQIMAKVPQLPDAPEVPVYYAHRPSETMLAYEPWTQFPKPWVEEMFKANSRLIAAAPDLLEALKEVARSPQRNCAKDHDPPGSGYGGCDCAGDMARAAIAKAEGKS